MQVFELIEELQHWNPDAKVHVGVDFGIGMLHTPVEIVEQSVPSLLGVTLYAKGDSFLGKQIFGEVAFRKFQMEDDGR